MERIPAGPTAMKISPETAADWLDNRNLSENRPFNNRRVSNHIVRKYAEAMSEGRWLLTHQGIAFDREGWLLDGQHRLHAIIEAGIPVEVMVIPGCDPETFSILDTGLRRQAGQLIPVNGKTVAAAARIIGTVTGAWSVRHVSAGIYDTQATNDQILAVVADWPELTELSRPVVLCYQKVRINVATHLAVAAQAQRGEYAGKLPAWFESLKSGEGLTGKDSRLLLRNRFIRDHRELNGGNARGSSYRFVARAWNAYAQDRQLGVLRAHDDMPPPEVL
jgi:hypothetical protein